MFPAWMSDSVVTSPALAAKVVGPVRDALHRFARDNHRELDGDVVEWLRSLDWAARLHHELRTALDADLDTSRGPEAHSVIVLDDDEISIAMAAEELGCSRQAVWDRIRRGTLVARKDDGGRRRIARRDLT